MDSQILTGLSSLPNTVLEQDTSNRMSQLFTKPDLSTPGLPGIEVPDIKEGSANLLLNGDKNINISDGDRMNSYLQQAQKFADKNTKGFDENMIVTDPQYSKFADEKYGYSVNRDNEDFYAQQDSILGRTAKGLGRFIGTALTKTATSAGYLGGMALNADKLFDEKAGSWITAAGDNGFVRFFQGLENDVKEDWLPVYQEAADRDKGFWGRALSDSTFWTNDVADGAAFMASAFLPGMALSKIGLGAKAASLLGKIAGGENEVLGAAEWGTKITNYLKNAEQVKQTFDKGLITLINTASESTSEAMGVRDSVLASLKGKINPSTGQEYTEEETKDLAGKAAKNTFLGNMLALSLSNFWEAGVMYKALGRNATEEAIGAGQRLSRNAIGEAQELISSTSKIGRALASKPAYYAKNALEGVLAEGLYEENVQLAIQRTNEGSGKYKGFWSQWANQTKDALTGDDREASMNIGIGGLMGAGFGGGTEIFNKEYTKTRQNNVRLLNAINNAQNNWLKLGDIYEKNADGSVATENGEPKIDEAKASAYYHVIMRNADLLKNADSLQDGTFKDIIKKTPFASFVASHIEAGVEDQLDKKLEDLKNAKPETLIALGLNPDENNLSQLQEYRDLSKKLIDLHKSINSDVLLRTKNDNQMDHNRKQELYDNGAKQLIIKQSIDKNNLRLSQIESSFANTNTSATDGFVDEYNTLTHRIEAQKKLLSSAAENKDDVYVDVTDEEKNLKELEDGKSKLLEDNKDSIVNLKKNGELYLYESEGKNRELLNNEKQAKIKETAELTNSVKSLNDEWYKVADYKNGYKYYSAKFNKDVDEMTADAEKVQTEAAIDAAKTNVDNAKSIKVKTKLSTGADFEYNLAEGQEYISATSEEKRKSQSGKDVAIYNNDHIRVISVNDDGSAVVSINNDAAVTLSQDELSSMGRLTNLNTLSPVQKFYVQNRNKSFFYRVPTGKGRGQSKIVQARLGLNKEKTVLMAVYGNNQKIALNRDFLTDAKGNKISPQKAFFDLSSLPTEAEAALNEQAKQLKARYDAQVKYIMQLIDQAETSISEQKQRATSVEAQISGLESKIDEYRNTLEDIFADEHNRDRRTKNGLKKAIAEQTTKLQNDIAMSEGLLADLKQQQKDLSNRQEVLKASLENYENFYDELANNDGLPLNIGTAEQNRLQSTQSDLERSDNRNTEQKLYDILEDTQAEIELTNERVGVVENTISEFKKLLSRWRITDRFLDIFGNGPSAVQTARVILRNRVKELQDLVRSEDDIEKVKDYSSELSEARNLLSMIIKSNPEAGENIRFLDIAAKEFKSYQTELNTLNDSVKALKEKESRLIGALNTKSDLQTNAARLNAIKDLYQALTNAYEADRVKNGVYENNNKVKVKNTSDKESFKKNASEVFDGQEVSDKEVTETAKPVLSNTALFKTAGSHFPGNVISSDEATQRFYKFTSDNNIAQGFLLQVVTEDNDKGNIRYINETGGYPIDADIKLVVTKRVNGKLVPVNMKGETVSEDKIGSEGVYTSMYSATQLLKGTDAEKIAWAKDNFTVTGLSDEQILKEVKKYLTIRDNIKNNIKSGQEVTLSVLNKSNGLENKVDREANGKFPQLSLEGRILSASPTSDDYKTTKLTVATAGTEAKSSTNKSVNIDGRMFALGRIAVTDKVTGNVYQVYNREFNNEEKSKIAKAVVRFSQLFINENRTPEETSERDRLYEYIYSTLYWNKPGLDAKQSTDELSVQEAVNPKQFWYSNGLHKGDTFIPASEVNEENVMKLLDGLYHQVSASRISKDSTNSSNFYEPNFKEDGTIEYKQWNSYKEYLMSGKENRQAPLYTNVVERSDYQKQPQFKNAYLTYAVPSAYMQAEKSVEPAINATPQIQQTKSEGVASLDDLREGESTTVYMTQKNGKKYIIGVKMEGGVRKAVSYQGFNPDGTKLESAKNEQTLRSIINDQVDVMNDPATLENFPSVSTIAPKEENKSVYTGKPSTTTPTKLTAIDVDDDYKRNIIEKKRQQELEAVYNTGSTITSYNRSIAAETDPVYKQELIDKRQRELDELIRDGEFTSTTDPINKRFNDELAALTPKIKTEQAPQISPLAALAALQSKYTFNPNEYNGGEEEVNRVAFREAKAKEDIDNFKNWLKQRLPQIDLKIVDKLINDKAWGALAGATIVLYNNAEEGTGYHEAFEATFKLFLSQQERNDLIDEFRARQGEFYNPFSGKTLPHSEASEYDAREMMAEEFRNYALNNGEQIDKGKPKKNTIFRKIWNWIKSFFKLSTNDKNTANELANSVYRKIEQGAYKDKTPSSFDSISYRAIPGYSQYDTNQVLEGLHAVFFSKLFTNNSNIEGLINSEDNNAFVNKLFGESRTRLKEIMSAPIQSTLKLLNEGKIPATDELANQLVEADRSVTDLLDNKYYTEIVPIYKQYLSRFGLEFQALSERDTQALIEKEGNTIDPLGIMDSMFIDSKNLATSSIRLLVASLVDARYDNKGAIVAQKNDRGFTKLVNYGQVLNTLLNELQGSVGYYKDGQYVSRIDEMFRRLDGKYLNSETGQYKNGFLWVKQLKGRLKYEDASGQKYSDINLSRDDIRFLTAFEKSFSNNKNLPIKMIVAKDGKIYSTDPIVTANINKIREQWRNNAKTLSSKGSVTLQMNDQAIVLVNKQSLNKINTDTFAGKQEFLKVLGIEFTIPDADIAIKGGKYFTKYNDAIQRIKSQLQDDKIKSFDDLFGKQVVNSSISALVEIEMSDKSENESLQYYNADGKSQYSITLPSLYSNVLNTLKATDKLSDFVLTNPQFGSVKDGVVYLNPYQANSYILKPGGFIFDENGNKRRGRDINYKLISGMGSETENEGVSTSSMKFPDKVAQELYHILNGTYFTVINSDKSSEFGVDLGHFFDYKSTGFINEIIQNHYVPHLVDELNSAIANRKEKSNIQYYRDAVENLGHFRNILSKSKDGLEQVLSGKISPEAFANSTQVRADITSYINEFVGKQKQTLIENGIIEKVAQGWKTNFISKDQLSSLGLAGDVIVDSDMNNLLRFIYVNHNIAVREQHKMIYGHTALYKDLPKRSNGVTSTKEQITENPTTISWMDTNMPRLDGVVRSSKEQQTFTNISYADNNVQSRYLTEIAEGIYESMKDSMSKEQAEKSIGAKFNNDGKVISLNPTKGSVVSAYAELNEADAQAYIMPDFYRDMLFLSSKWSDKQEKQWNYEVAYERLVRSATINNRFGAKLAKNDSHYKDFYKGNESLKEQDLAIYKKGSPGAVMPTLKPQYFGYQVNDSLMHTTFLKNSVTPQFYRWVEGTVAQDNYIKHQNNKVDVIGFESGEKVGNIFDAKGKFTSQYKDGSIDSTIPPVQELYTRHFGIQVEMAAKQKDSVIIGSQMRKLVLSNLMKNGVAVTPEIASMIEDYTSVINDMVELGKETLLDELGLSRDEDGNYQTNDLSHLLDTLRREAISRDMPDNIVDSLATAIGNPNQLAYKFDTLPIKERIDNILNSIADSRVISQKIHGKAPVQVAVSGFEHGERSFVYLDKKTNTYKEVKGSDLKLLTKEEQASAKMTSSELKFYRKEDGKISAMEVLLPWHMSDVKEQDITDPRLLEAIGFRIPTQALSQIDNIIIKGFLPREMGDAVVIPSEMVGKSGGDFDIDKLNMYLANYYVQDGKPVYIESGSREEVEKLAKSLYAQKAGKKAGLSIESAERTNNFGDLLLSAFDNTDPAEEDFIRDFYKKSLENKLIQKTKALLELPQNYRQLMMPNSAATLQALEEEILNLKGRQKDKIDPTGLGEWNNMAMTRLRFITGKALVGVGALHVTAHTISQIAGNYLTGQYRDRDGNVQDISIALPHTNLRLDNITTEDGQWISELLSEAMTGFVDAAKDPFVFELNINFNTAATYFYLMKLGVPMNSNVYFHTQPVIEDYVKNIDKNNSLINDTNGDKGSFNDVKYQTLDKFYKTLFGTTLSDKKASERDKWIQQADGLIADFKKKNPEYSNKQLVDNIRSLSSPSHVITREEAIRQIAVLNDYIEYTTQAGKLGNFINALGYDTRGTKNIIENKLQQIDWEKVVEENFVANPNDALSSTFLGAMKEHKDDISNMFKDYFLVLQDKMTPAMNKAFEYIKAQEYMSGDDKANFLNRYQNFLINYVLHTSKIFDRDVNNNPVSYSINQFYSLLSDNSSQESFAKQLANYKKLYPNNLALAELYPIINSNRNLTDNIKMFANKASTFELNNFIESVSELKNQAIASSDKDLFNFVKRLAVFSMIQGGIQTSPISYNKILPVEIYSNIVGNAIDRFNSSNEEVNADLIWKQFHQNNFKNSGIVNSYMAKWTYDSYADEWGFSIRGVGIDTQNKTANVSSKSPIASKEFFITKYPKNLDKENRERLIANKQWDDLWDYRMYQKVGELENGTFLYKQINTLGNGMFHTEAYSQDTAGLKVSQLKNSAYYGYIEEATQQQLEANNRFANNEDVSLGNSNMGSINFVEEQSSGYRGRTIKNASADITLAFASDFNSAGEKLTKSSVLNQNKIYHPISINNEFNYEMNEIYTVANKIKALNKKAIIINIAGNGIYTFKGQYTQEQIDEHIENYINDLTYELEKDGMSISIRTGGQTGADEAGAKAGLSLGFPTTVLAPKGWTFRNENGQDISDEKQFKARFPNSKQLSQGDLFAQAEQDLEDNGTIKKICP